MLMQTCKFIQEIDSGRMTFLSCSKDLYKLSNNTLN